MVTDHNTIIFKLIHHHPARRFSSLSRHGLCFGREEETEEMRCCLSMRSCLK
ncbi:unnamed protein product [Linum tenue]|uniref:Uncharacterized protein n=1 Tax=Linum tenue TaxID=586396 RepID=A0AAV0RYC8_9ROSI|nr:unnamed protein product [Linum tenue]